MAKDILSRMWEDPTKPKTQIQTYPNYNIGKLSNTINDIDDEIIENVYPVAYIIKKKTGTETYFIRKVVLSIGLKYMFSPTDPNKQLLPTSWNTFKEAIEWCDEEELSRPNVMVIKGEGKYKDPHLFFKEISSCIDFLESSTIIGN